MLKFLLDSLDGLDDATKALYVEKDGKFQLDIDGLEDTSALKRAKDHEKQARQAAETKANELTTQLTALQEQITQIKDDKARGNGDVDALEKSWQEKLTKRENELTTQIEGLTGNLKGLLVDNEATRLAAELAGDSASLILPHIKTRLGVTEKDGKQVTAVFDTQGQLSALTLDELKKEFADNPAFAPVIVGSRASGGANGSSGNFGASSNHSTATNSYLSQVRGQ